MPQDQPFGSARGANERAEEFGVEPFGTQSFGSMLTCADREVACGQELLGLRRVPVRGEPVIETTSWCSRVPLRPAASSR